MKLKRLCSETRRLVVIARERYVAHRNNQPKTAFLTAALKSNIELMRLNIALLDAARGCSFLSREGGRLVERRAAPIRPSELAREMHDDQR